MESFVDDAATFIGVSDDRTKPPFTGVSDYGVVLRNNGGSHR